MFTSQNKNDNNNSNKSIKDNQPEIEIREMRTTDIDGAIDCFADSYDEFDAPITVRAFLRTFPGTFFVATKILSKQNEQEHKEKIVGVCAAPRVTQGIAFIGLYGVHPDHRGTGIGSRLFRRCLDAATNSIETRGVGLYAVPTMRQKYATQSGFVYAENVSMVNYVGQLSSSVMQRLQVMTEQNRDAKIRFFDNSSVESMNELLLQEIIEYDCAIHDDSRERLLRNALTSEGYSTCAVSAEDGKIQGYACVRPHVRSGRLMLGPIYANRTRDAELLVAQLLLRESNRTIAITGGVTMNAIDAQPELCRLAAETIGLVEIERCERLFRSETPIAANYSLIYGVFSPDFSL